MYYHNRFDGHVHSDCSPRGTDSVMSLCEQSIHRRLMGFAVTDCCDCDRFDEMQFADRIRESVYSVYKARSVFEDSLKILNGIEISQPLDNPEKANKIVSGVPFDIVLVSLKKCLDGRALRDINFNELMESEIIKLFESYFTLLLKTVKWDNYDVLSQLTLPIRYINSDSMPYISIRYFDDIVEEILKTLAENGKGLEVNTSALRNQLDMILPPVRYLRMFKELGGEFITVGSGAHNCQNIGADLSEGISIVHEAGFSNYCYFEHRKPVLINID